MFQNFGFQIIALLIQLWIFNQVIIQTAIMSFYLFFELSLFSLQSAVGFDQGWISLENCFGNPIALIGKTNRPVLNVYLAQWAPQVVNFSYFLIFMINFYLFQAQGACLLTILLHFTTSYGNIPPWWSVRFLRRVHVSLKIINCDKMVSVKGVFIFFVSWLKTYNWGRQRDKTDLIEYSIGQ